MQNARLVSALRLPSGMFSENAGTEVVSDLIVLQKQGGKEIGKGLEEAFVETASVPKGDGFSIAFNHSQLFEGAWEDVRPRLIATSREMSTDPYGKPTWVYKHDGGVEGIAHDLKEQLTEDIAQKFDRKLYETGVAMTEEERQAEAAKELRKLGVTAGLPEEEKAKEEAQKSKVQDEDNASNLLPDSVLRQVPKLYATEKTGQIGDKVAYARYFFPMGAYTAYLLEYDPKERLGFGAVTMGYGWELGYMSFDEMREINVMGLGIERDLYFTPKRLHEIAELEELVQGRYTQEEHIESVGREARGEPRGGRTG